MKLFWRVSRQPFWIISLFIVFACTEGDDKGSDAGGENDATITDSTQDNDTTTAEDSGGESCSVSYSVDIQPIMGKCGTPMCHPGQYNSYEDTKKRLVDQGWFESYVAPKKHNISNTQITTVRTWITCGAPNN